MREEKQITESDLMTLVPGKLIYLGLSILRSVE